MRRFLCIVWLTGGCLFGQMSSSVSFDGSGFRRNARFGAAYSTYTVSGRPYSAEEISEFLQVLADGTRFARTTPGAKVFRDSVGRTRRERSMFQAPAGAAPAPEIRIIEIIDPVLGVKYTLDTSHRVAHRQQLTAFRPPARTASPPPPQPPASARPQHKTEQLGQKMIEGVMAQGVRSTATYPAGYDGADRPFSSSHESWEAVDLKVSVLHVSRDPRRGENTTKLINIDRSEPDPALFQPPPDYKVVDEGAEFEIVWGTETK